MGQISTSILSDSDGEVEGLFFGLASTILVVGSEGFVMGGAINRVLLLERRSLEHGDGEFFIFEPELIFSRIVGLVCCV